MIRPKIATKDLLLSITKNCETLIHQTGTRGQEMLECKKVKPRAFFHFNPPLEVKDDWMIGLTTLEVHNSVFNITEEIIKFELYKFSDEKAGGVSYEKVRDEIGKGLDTSDNTYADLQDDIICPNIIEDYREQVTKRMEDDKYMIVLALYIVSIFQDFKSFLRTEIDLVEDDIRVVLDEYNSSFDTYELEPGL